MLKKIEIEGFRGLKAISCQDFSPFNLIIGPNNCGKTSFLEALQVFSGPLDIQNYLAIISGRGAGFHPNSFHITEQLRWIFSQNTDSNSQRFSIKGEDEKFSREIAVSFWTAPSDKALPNPPGNYSQQMRFAGPPSAHTERNETAAIVGRLEATLQHNEGSSAKKQAQFDFPASGPLFFPQENLETIIPTIFIEPSPQKHLEAGIEKISAILQAGLKDKYISLLQTIDPEVKDVQILLTKDRSPYVALDYGNLGLTPLSIHGDGLRRVNHFAGSLAETAGGMILIDEFENAIHLKALNDVIRLLVSVLKSKPTQVFATTHSLECIDAVANAAQETPELFSLFYFSEGSSGAVLKRLAGEDVISVRQELGSDVRLFP